MSDGLSTTDARPDARPDAADPAGRRVAPDLTAFWNVLSGTVASDALRSRAAQGLRAGARPDREPRTADAFWERLAGEGRVQWEELRGLVEAFRGFDVNDRVGLWVDRRGAAARTRIETRWHSARATLVRRPEPSPEGATPPEPATEEIVPGPRTPALPPQWSAVVPDWSGLATRRHYCVPTPSEPPPMPTPRLGQPALTRALAAAVAAVAVAALAVVATSAPSARDVAVPAAPPAAAPPAPAPQSAPPATPAQPSSATSPNGTAHAEFQRDLGRFVLYDDRRDGRSAVLQFRVDGKDREPQTNAAGITDGTHPPQEILVRDLAAASSVEFRVCVARPGTTVRQQNCGGWSRDPAR